MRKNAICISALTLVIASPAWACSICRCGDPTFNALGKEGIAQPGWRFAVDWEEVRKSQGTRDEEFSSVTEHRLTALVAWGLSDRINLFARVPYSERRLLELEDGDEERAETSALSDPEFSAQVRLWSSALEGDVGVRTSLYAVGGVKTDWGENDASSGGERLDEHVQPGTGSTDWFVGLSGSHQVNPRSALFASLQYRSTGRNDAGYRYGSSVLLNVAYEHKISSRWDAVLEANFRDSQRDETDAAGTTDGDTGGTITYLTPRILFDAGGGWVIRGSAQIPLSQSGLNGVQHEEPVLNIGVTRLIKSP